MRITKQARRHAKELFRSCLAEGRLDENRVRDAVAKVLAAKPRGYLAVLSHFRRLVKLALDQRSARVESAVPLSADVKGRVEAGLTQAYGPGLDVAFALTPPLIGGLKIRVGSDVYDGTIKGRLAALQESFS